MSARKGLRILISSAGRRVELIRCFRGDAESLGLDLTVVAADHNPNWSAACRTADTARAVPRCSDPDFIPALLSICEREKTDLLVPTIDTELLPISNAIEAFAKIGTRAVVSKPSVVAMARDKLATHQFFEAIGIGAPRTVTLAALFAGPDCLKYPVILKPRDGSSASGICLAKDINAVRSFGLDVKRYIAQERLEGREYTVNLFFGPSGALRCSVPHWRAETRAGEVSKAVTERLPCLMATAQRLGNNLVGGRGPMCFQAFVSQEGRAVAFELNARFGGGYPLAHAAGARFTQWLLEEAVGIPPSNDHPWQDRLVMLRYDAAVLFASKDKE